MSEQYINPFHADTIAWAQALDDCIIKSDWERQWKLVEEIEASVDNYDSISQANIYYCLGTTYRNINERESNIQHLERQFFCYRKSINLLIENQSGSMESTPYIWGLFLPLCTNYANLLDSCGRRISAIRYYLEVLAVDNDFSMALGNLGKAYHYYAELVWSHVPRDYFNHCAYVYLSRAVRIQKGTYPEAIDNFKRILKRYNPEYIEFLKKNLDMGNYRYTGEEERYRKWALSRALFLNPLNDLPFQDLYIATDDIHLPDMIMKIGEKPIFHGLYNQLKQEYIFARFVFYESLQEPGETHFADKETCLWQFADYPSYSIRIEKMKTAFRIVYSLLDKVGYFLNQYFDLGIFEKDIYFGRIWRTKRINQRDQLTNVLKPETNIALTALQWIGKELATTSGTPTNPSASRMGEIRNALEHKYVKVYNEIFPARVDGEIDDLAFYISEKELEEYTYDLLSLLREALINLAFAVHIEEVKKKKELDPDTIVPPVFLLNYEDEWKL